MANEQPTPQPAPKIATKMVGSVTTPKVARPGNGPLWDALRSATTKDELAELDYRASEIGYSETGELRKAITAKIANLEGMTDG